MTLELLRDRLGSVIACSTDANQGKAGPFVVERIDYMGGYGAAAYSDIICAGYVTDVDSMGGTVTLGTFTHFEPGVTSLSPFTDSLACIDPGSDDSDYNLVDSASWVSDEIEMTTSAYANFSVGDYIEIWSKPLKRHASTTPTESNGRTTVTTAAGFSPLSSDALVGCYLMDLDAGDLRVPVVITDNDTSGFTVEGTNLYTDTEFADGENYFRVYRRSSAVGNPFGFAGGWLVGGNVYVSSSWRSVKQLWYFWNRHYEPEYLLRWLQPDPIGPWGDRASRGAWFSYTGMSPIRARDVRGLDDGEQQARGKKLDIWTGGDWTLSDMARCGFPGTYNGESLSDIVDAIIAEALEDDCDCISEIHFHGHCGYNGRVVLGTDVIDASGPTREEAERLAEQLREMGQPDAQPEEPDFNTRELQLLEELERLKPYLCPDANIYIKQCSAGRGTAGSKLLRTIAARTGATVHGPRSFIEAGGTRATGWRSCTPEGDESTTGYEDPDDPSPLPGWPNDSKGKPDK